MNDPMFEIKASDAPQRLDAALVSRGLLSGRDRACELIKLGRVFVNGKPCTKPARKVTAADALTVDDEGRDFVSRGGVKLEHAMQAFHLTCEGLVCADIGASTGGFTDCMLRRGAAKVYAIDVGRDQLDPRLRADPRVVSMEETNIRDVTPESLEELPAFMTTDVSFISLRTIFDDLCALLAPGGTLAALIKPQFEAGRSDIGKNGVVTNPRVHERVLRDVCADAQAKGLGLRALTYSPIRGPAGNIEYLAHFVKGGGSIFPDLSALVKEAHLRTKDSGKGGKSS